MPVNLRRDPVLQGLSSRAWDAYLAAAAWSAEFERDGIYVATGKHSVGVRECIEKGALSVTDGDGLEVYRWPDLMPSKQELDQKRAEARERMGRVRANRTRTSQEVPTSPSTSDAEVVVEGSQLQPSRRDEAYEALGDFCYGKWRRLPQRARGRINQALGELRQIHRDEDIDLAAEIRVRSARARAWQPDWAWTPQTLVEKWPLLERDIQPTAKLKAARGLALADQLEAQGR
jgi:hypothetical protein